MSETVYRVRGGGLDDDNNPIAPSADVELTASAVAPGATRPYVDRGRDGETVEYTVYFVPAVDLESTDQLRVRGSLYNVQVEDWRSAYGTGRTGTVALCSLGRG